MEAHVGVVKSTMNVMDSEALLTPRILDRIAAAVMARIDRENLRRARSGFDRDLRGRVSEDDRGGRS